MCSFSEEEIKKYLDILHKYKKSQKEKAGEEGEEDKNKCSYCRKNKGYSIYSGYKLCDNCGCQNGHVWGILIIKIMID